MNVMVQATTDQVPALLEVIEQRQAQGLDRFDEWWQGVYHIVTGPSPEHGELLTRLLVLLDPLASAAGLRAAQSVTIGVDKVDARVPDLAVYRPDTERTSPAFLATAELVVEVLSPAEPPGQKLDFYADRGVREYLEIDLATGDVRLLTRRDTGWTPIEHSHVLDLTVADVAALVHPAG